MRGQDPTKQTKPERKDQHESAFVQIERAHGRRTSKFLRKEEWEEQEESHNLMLHRNNTSKS